MSISTLVRAEGEHEPERPRAGGRGAGVLSLVVGALGVLCALALPFAPVIADQTVVRWPDPSVGPVSTTAFFNPYRPAEVHVSVPCTAIQGALGGPDRTIFATTFVRSSQPPAGLVVDTQRGALRVLLNGRALDVPQPVAGNCDLRFDANDDASTFALGSATLNLPGEAPPEVHAISSDLPPDALADASFTARTRTWFESVPAPAKLGLVAGWAALAVCSFALLWRGAGDRRNRGERIEQTGYTGWHRWLRVLADVGVLGSLTAWPIIGPLTDDDGYATMTMRNGVRSGDIGNYYHWFNGSEAPFTLVQHLVQPLIQISVAPVFLRLPSYLVAVAAWFVISRGVLGAALPALARAWWFRALTGVCFLAWWLPYGTGVRPEPFVALGAATVFALLLRGTGPGARRGLFTVGVAALTAGLTLAVTPAGILVFAPILVLLPRIWRVLTDHQAVRGLVEVSKLAGRVALLACLACVGVVLMFADQSLHAVRKATQLHTEIGPSLEWYQELTRYDMLLGGGSSGTATKRLVVLMMIALLIPVGALIYRRVRVLTGMGDMHVLTVAAIASVLLLWLTPSKWTHHFGAVAGAGVPFLAAAIVLLVTTARQCADNRGVLVAGLTGGCFAAVAAGLAFSGANDWYLYSNYSMPWFDRKVTPLGVPLNSPILWVGGVLLLAGGVGLYRWRSNRSAAAGSARSVLAAAPGVIAGVSLLVSVAVLLYGFVIAPLRQSPNYSLAAKNIDSLVGDGNCGIVDDVEVYPDLPDGVLAPELGAPELSGFTQNGGYLTEPEDPQGIARLRWGSNDDGVMSTGSLTSQWFRLPRLTGDQQIAISAAGLVGEANRVALEFGRTAGTGSADLLVQRVLDDHRGDHPGWRPIALPAAEVPAGADVVRVLATDGAAYRGGWVAVTGPRLRSVMPLRQFLVRRGPVLVDWPMSFTVPCVKNVPLVADGLTQPPEVILAVPHAYDGNASIAYNPGQGGSFAGAKIVGQFHEVSSALRGQPWREWGHVLVLDYPVAIDTYTKTTTHLKVTGTRGDK